MSGPCLYVQSSSLVDISIDFDHLWFLCGSKRGNIDRPIGTNMVEYEQDDGEGGGIEVYAEVDEEVGRRLGTTGYEVLCSAVVGRLERHSFQKGQVIFAAAR